MQALTAGTLNKRITLMQSSSEQDPLTGAAGPDSTVAAVWAAIKPGDLA